MATSLLINVHEKKGGGGGGGGGGNEVCVGGEGVTYLGNEGAENREDGIGVLRMSSGDLTGKMLHELGERARLQQRSSAVRELAPGVAVRGGQDCREVAADKQPHFG